MAIPAALDRDGYSSEIWPSARKIENTIAFRIPDEAIAQVLPSATEDYVPTKKEVWDIVQLSISPGRGFSFDRPYFADHYAPEFDHDVWEIYPDGIVRPPIVEYTRSFRELFKEELKGVLAAISVAGEDNYGVIHAHPDRWLELVALATSYRLGSTTDFQKVVFATDSPDHYHTVNTPQELYNLTDVWLEMSNGTRNASIIVSAKYQSLIGEMVKAFYKEGVHVNNSASFYNIHDRLVSFNVAEEITAEAVKDQRPVSTILAEKIAVRCQTLESVVAQHIYTLTGQTIAWAAITDGSALTGLANVMKTAKARMQEAKTPEDLETAYREGSAAVKAWTLPTWGDD